MIGMSDEDECQICFTIYNDSDSKYIRCQYCNIKSCENCMIEYFKIDNIMKCISCNQGWTYDFMECVFDINMLKNTIYPIIEEKIYSLEENMFAGAQSDVQLLLDYRKRQKKISELKLHR
jgi:hypothetical protein